MPAYPAYKKKEGCKGVHSCSVKTCAIPAFRCSICKEGPYKVIVYCAHCTKMACVKCAGKVEKTASELNNPEGVSYDAESGTKEKTDIERQVAEGQDAEKTRIDEHQEEQAGDQGAAPTQPSMEQHVLKEKEWELVDLV